jgi:uncharacterized RDD family membrane protein YckC
MSSRRFKTHNHPNASLIKRLLAMVYDSLLVMALWMLVGFVSIAFNDMEAVEASYGGAFIGSSIFIVTFLFFAFFWTRSGQTLGMIAWRLRIETDQGQPINTKQALIRFMGALISSFFGLGYWWIMFDSNKLSWHDHWSNSRVVQLPKK